MSVNLIMHELGVATSIMESVCEAAKVQEPDRVTEIYLKVGSSSSIVEKSLIAAFDILRELEHYKICANAQLKITIEASKSICLECCKEFSHKSYLSACPYCKNSNIQLISGNDIYIDKIKVENA